MNQDSHVTQRLTEAQEKPIHRARFNMVWDLEWRGVDINEVPIFRVAQFEVLRHAHEYVHELASSYELRNYTITRI